MSPPSVQAKRLPNQQTGGLGEWGATATTPTLGSQFNSKWDSAGTPLSLPSPSTPPPPRTCPTPTHHCPTVNAPPLGSGKQAPFHPFL